MPESAAPLSSVEELQEVWDAFRTGSPATCPTDGSSMALSVDGSVGVYRFVCTRCGTASVWFESGPNGMTLRTGPGKAPALEEG
jgi:hypothetical protein